MELWANWMLEARCRGDAAAGAMDESSPEEIVLAKKRCAQCPVAVKCLLLGERIAEECGVDQAQGIWGGFTHRERIAMRLLGRAPTPCTRCGLDCVPAREHMTECQTCRPSIGFSLDEYLPAVRTMISQGLSAQDAADRIGVLRRSLQRKCKAWKVSFITKSVPLDVRPDLQPCGTVAAKLRHHRKEPGSWRNCPSCRNVPWNKIRAERGPNRKT